MIKRNGIGNDDFKLTSFITNNFASSKNNLARSNFCIPA